TGPSIASAKRASHLSAARTPLKRLEAWKCECSWKHRATTIIPALSFFRPSKNRDPTCRTGRNGTIAMPEAALWLSLDIRNIREVMIDIVRFQITIAEPREQCLQLLETIRVELDLQIAAIVAQRP